MLEFKKVFALCKNNECDFKHKTESQIENKKQNYTKMKVDNRIDETFTYLLEGLP